MGIATSGLNELIVAIRRSQDQHNLLEKIVPHLEKLLQVDINIDKGKSLLIILPECQVVSPSSECQVVSPSSSPVYRVSSGPAVEVLL